MTGTFIIRPKSLQQRMALFVLAPLFLMLVVMGLLGFFYARDIILQQWGETAVANLQRAAHKIDMRLARPKEMVQLIHQEYGQEPGYGDSHRIHQFIVDQIKAMGGVAAVNVKWPEELSDSRYRGGMGRTGSMRMQFSRMSQVRTSPPRFNPRFNSETVSLVSEFVDKDGKKVGSIEVVIEFRDLLNEIIHEPWWKTNQAYIITNEGDILSDESGVGTVGEEIEDRFGAKDPLEKMTLEAIGKHSSGTVFGPGRPPDKISGFSHLKEAPWDIVIIAPGRQVLKPLLQFRFYYFATGIGFVLLILVFIRGVLSRTTKDIKKVSAAAGDIAEGRFGSLLKVSTRDEVGDLTQNFNVMSRQLQERLRLKADMDLAGEMQRNLLPASNHKFVGLEICGKVIYCDETGGDYFDVIRLPGPDERICVVVGDVVGHGIAAALLMTTTRALLRSCLLQNLSLAESMSLVNRLLCRDTDQSGSFVTLFAMVADTGKKEVTWVRAGHDPALWYDPTTGEMRELRKDGVVLGLDEAVSFSGHVCTQIKTGSVFLIGTDGAWEIENTAGERLGREPIKEVLRMHADESADTIVDHMTARIDGFRGEARQKDDITLVTIKFS